MSYFGVPIRNGLPIGLGSVAGFGIAPFEPYSLFENGEQGAWYDPSDFSTLFDDSAGTTPVSAPGNGADVWVGLMLDKSKGLVLGSELVTNGDFSSGTTGWTFYQSTLSAVSGKLRVTALGGAPGAYQSISIVSGRTYEITFDIDVGTVGTGAYFVGNTGLGGPYTISASGKQTFRFLSTTTNAAFLFYIHRVSGATPGQYFDLDNVSVKELAGNHAFQTNDPKRPKLAARYNLLTYTEQFDNALWVKLNATAANTTATTDPLGGTAADKIVENATTNSHGLYQQVNGVLVSASGITFTVYAKAAERNWLIIDAYIGNDVNCYFDLQNGALGTMGANCSGLIQNVGNGWYKCSVTRTATAGTYNLALILAATTGNNQSSYTGDGTSGIYIWGADLRPASQATGLIGPTYQRVVDAATYDTAGFLPYLEFNGLSWSMSTNSIDFSAVPTDKMTVWAGVRKQAAGLGMIAELSTAVASNNGSFYIAADNGTNDYGVSLRGTAQVTYQPATYAAPITNVISAAFDIGAAAIADENKPRVNGVLEQDNPTGADAGTGNFGNYPLFIGARNNASLFFQGWLTSLIVRGAQSTQSQIEATESWVNGKTGAF
jgi:hypothetical protein